LTLSAEPKIVSETSPIAAETVRAHVGRILKTPDFAAAPQLSAFLEYIVERTLAGEANTLKAYTIATEALGRPMNFDPQSDPIVRVQARRLRQALLLYYASAGAGEPMRLVLPVGGYVPEFVGSAEAAAAHVAAMPQVPSQQRMFPTPWVAPVALILSTISIIMNLLLMWPEAIIALLRLLR
jgi:hypothetical protein